MNYEYYANIAADLNSNLLLQSFATVSHVWQMSESVIDEPDEVRAYRIELETRLKDR